MQHKHSAAVKSALRSFKSTKISIALDMSSSHHKEGHLSRIGTCHLLGFEDFSNLGVLFTVQCVMFFLWPYVGALHSLHIHHLVNENLSRLLPQPGASSSSYRYLLYAVSL